MSFWCLCFCFACFSGGDDPTLPRAERTGTDDEVQPSEREAAYIDGGKIYLIDVVTTTEKVIVDDLKYDRPITWSPDGKTLLYWKHSDVGWDIWALEIESGAATNLTNTTSGGCRSPSFSPDGTRIAFMRDLPAGLYIMNRDGSDSRRLTALGHRDAAPSWSSDGQSLVFEDGSTVYLIATSGGDPSALVKGGREASWCPIQGPDPGPVLYVARRGDEWHLCTLRPGTSEETALVKHPRRLAHPRWSPDGKWIAYFETREAGASLRVVRSTGEGDRSMGIIPSRPYPPTWSPCSGYLGYASGGKHGLPLHWTGLEHRQVRIVTPRSAGWPRWRPRLPDKEN